MNKPKNSTVKQEEETRQAEGVVSRNFCLYFFNLNTKKMPAKHNQIKVPTLQL